MCRASVVVRHAGATQELCSSFLGKFEETREQRRWRTRRAHGTNVSALLWTNEGRAQRNIVERTGLAEYNRLSSAILQGHASFPARAYRIPG